MNYSGEASIGYGPVFKFIGNGEQTMVTAYVSGAMAKSAMLNSSNTSAILYNSSSVGDCTVTANLSIASGKVTLSYSVEYSGQNSTSTVTGILGSWPTN